MFKVFLCSMLMSVTLSFSAAGSDLTAAIESGNIVQVKELLSGAPENVNKKGERGLAPLHIAATANQLEIARYLLEHGAEVEIRDQYGRTPLLGVAFANGSVELASLLVEYGANVNAADNQGGTSLNLAAWRGFRGLIDFLLTKGANVEASGPGGAMLFNSSLEKGLGRLFQALVEKGFVIPEPGVGRKNLLFSAAQGGSVEILEKLIDRGYAVGETDVFGWTPLHYAARGGRAQAVQTLIGKGADINARTVSGLSPYNLALEEGRDDVAGILVAQNADTSPRKFPKLTGPYFGQTPPGTQPSLFAPGIVSTNDGGHGGITFSLDGREAYWSAQYYPSDSGYAIPAVLTSRESNGFWTIPEFPEFTKGLEYCDGEPFLSRDGKSLYFLSRRSQNPGEPTTRKESVWIVERDNSGWGKPYPAPGAINNLSLHWQMSVSKSGDMYIQGRSARRGDIYVSKWINGEYQTPQTLDSMINSPGLETCPYIAPDESYLLFSSDGREYDDLHIYISFKTKDNQWGKPIATGLWGVAALVSNDGRYLFYNGTVNGLEGFYWLDASYLQSLKPDKR